MTRLSLILVALTTGLTLLACGNDGGGNPIPTVVDAAIDAAPTETDAAVCVGPNGCFSCEPVETDDFLDACTDGSCFAFDNVARLPRFNNGTLPPLP